MDREIRAHIDALAAGARAVVLPALNALIAAHARVEAESAASLPLFRDAIPHALALLTSREDGVRHQSAVLLAAIRSDATLVVPRLADALRRCHDAQDSDTYCLRRRWPRSGPRRRRPWACWLTSCSPPSITPSSSAVRRRWPPSARPRLASCRPS